MADVKLVSKVSVTMDHSGMTSILPRAAPAFTLPPRNSRISVGSTVRIDGKISGCPDPRVTWYRNGEPILNGGRYTVELSARGTFCLMIKDVKVDDDGKYTCEASNEEGVRQVTIELTVEGTSAVKYSLSSSLRGPGGPISTPTIENRLSIWGESPPKFVTKPNHISVKVGQTGKLSFKITGRPQPSVTWHKDRVQLLNEGRYKMYNKSGVYFFEIQGVSEVDTGIYTCSVVNNCGKSFVSTELVVQESDKADRTTPSVEDSVTQAAKTVATQITSNGCLKTQRVINADKAETPESASGKCGPTSDSTKKHSVVQSKRTSSVSSNYLGYPSRTGSPGLKDKLAPLTNIAIHGSKTNYPKPPARISSKETPAIVYQYTSVLESKANLPFSSKEILTQASKVTDPASHNTFTTHSKMKIPFEKETYKVSPKETAFVTSYYPYSVESKVRPTLSTKDAANTLTKEKSTIASRYTSNIESNMRSHSTPKVTMASQETPYNHTSVLNKMNSISTHVLQDPAQKDSGLVMLTSHECTDESFKDTSSLTPRNLCLKETPLTSIMDRKNKYPLDPPIKIPYVATKETLKKANYLTPKLDETKEATNTYQSINNISQSHQSSPSNKSNSEKKDVISQSYCHQSPMEVTSKSSATVSEIKFQQKSSSTITLKSVKIQPHPPPEYSCDVRKWKEEKPDLFPVIQKVSPVSDDHQKGEPEAHISDFGTVPNFDLTQSSQEVFEGSDIKFQCKGLPAEQLAPRFDQLLKSCSVMEGQDFVLGCTVKGKPPPEIGWLLNDQPIQYARATYEEGLAKLTVQDALPEDEGVYTCMAHNSYGTSSCLATVAVTEKKSSLMLKGSRSPAPEEHFAPVFVKGLSDLQVMDGSQVVMSVEVSANPTAKIIWFHNSKEIQETEDFHYEHSGNMYCLCIQEVFPEDTGKYICEAWNSLGQARTEAKLTVQEPQEGIQPWFISKPKPMLATPGQNALISCAISGDPFPKVQWLKDGRELSGFEVLQNEDIFTLILRNVQEGDTGLYQIKLK